MAVAKYLKDCHVKEQDWTCSVSLRGQNQDQGMDITKKKKANLGLASGGKTQTP